MADCQNRGRHWLGGPDTDTCADCGIVVQHDLEPICDECGSDMSIAYRAGCATANCDDDEDIGCEGMEEDGWASVEGEVAGS